MPGCNLPHVCPVLDSSDVDASADFLCAMGLAEAWRAGDDEGAQHGELVFHGGLISVNRHREGTHELAPGTVALRCETGNLDSLRG